MIRVLIDLQFLALFVVDEQSFYDLVANTSCRAGYKHIFAFELLEKLERGLKCI